MGKVGETDARQCVEEVGLRGADAARVLRARAESAAGCHAVIVWGVPPLADRMPGSYDVARDAAGRWRHPAPPVRTDIGIALALFGE